MDLEANRESSQSTIAIKNLAALVTDSNILFMMFVCFYQIRCACGC